MTDHDNDFDARYPEDEKSDPAPPEKDQPGVKSCGCQWFGVQVELCEHHYAMLFIHPHEVTEEKNSDPTGCFRDYSIRDDYRWFVRFSGELRDGPYLEETARLIYQQEKARRAALTTKGDEDV